MTPFGSSCPHCRRAECVTVKELSVIVPAHWTQLWRRHVRRIICGYLQQCPECMTTFVVTLRGVEPMESLTPQRQDADEADGKPRERKKRPEQPAWRTPPGV